MSPTVKLILLLGMSAVSAFMSCGPDAGPVERLNVTESIQRLPGIDPDYSDTVIPPNIAPMNFRIDEPGLRYVAHVHPADGNGMVISAGDGRICFPVSPWKRLLNGNRGRAIYIDIYAEYEKNRWRRFEPVSIRIAPDSIDTFLAYRLIEPQYKYYHQMGLYQRNLENFSETCFLHNRVTGDNCMNCHTFYQNRARNMIFHMRSGAASGTMLIRDGQIKKINTATDFNRAGAYAFWHPDGKRIVFSVNKLKQFFHATGESRDVLDMGSDLILYDIRSNTVTTDPGISDPERLETFPSWSPDGRYLYFCSAAEFESFFTDKGDLLYDDIRYDLMRVPYDAETGIFGPRETVISSEETGQSILMPRISPDGKYLMFCMCRYGNFPVYRPDSDLYVLDLAGGRYFDPGINSDVSADSYHSWSGNSRWVVFSSKRDNGLCARPYISYLDRDGRFHKPFVVPQKDPEFYTTFLKTYNVPEFSRDPVPFRWQNLVRAAFDNERMLNAKPDTGVQTGRVPDKTPAEEEWKQKPPR
ncbi:PD40 domain-containing protein [bacterium]|nr:PD40 domain-containing protein [bacterium]